MRRTLLALACVLGLSGLAGGIAVTRSTNAEPASANKRVTPSEPQADVTRVGVWQPPSGLNQFPIWPNGAPDMEGASQPPESVLTAQTPEAIDGDTSEAVFNVTDPTITVFSPRGRNTGAAVIVMPGGGYRAVVITVEGTEICSWVTSKGMTCILLKYRVPKSNHYWDNDCRCAITPRVPRALQDAQRTIKLVRARAKELNLDPDKIGVMGFSAGGYMAVQASNIFAPTYKSVDAIDKLSSRPDFTIAFYPGHLCRTGSAFDPSIRVTKKTSPTFLLQAWDDSVNEICNSTLYARALDEAGVPAEVHLFAKGGHAFGLRRSQSPDTVWPSLVENWLTGIGVL